MLHFEILKTFINLDKNTLILLFIFILYYLKNYKIYLDLIFFSKFILNINFEIDSKNNGRKNDKKRAYNELKFEI